MSPPARFVAPLSALVMIAQQVGSVATRDALFLSYYPVTYLPVLIALSAILSFPAALGLGRALARHGPKRVVPILFGVGGLLFAVEFKILNVEPKIATLLLYLHASIQGPLTISAFWSLLNERFDPHSAKQPLSNVAVGAALGGLLGGLGTERVAVWMQPSTMLLILAAGSFLCATGVLLLGAGRWERAVSSAGQDQSAASGWTEIRRVPYLTDLAIVITHAACLATLVDYVMKAEVANHFANREGLLRFFGIFYATTGAAAFLVQILLGRKTLQRWGLAGCVASHPIAVLAATVGGFFLPSPWRGILPRAADTTIRNSIFRAGYELLYTPLAQGSKRSAKALIDVGLDCLGKGIGAGLILLLAFIAPGQVVWWVNIAAVLAAAMAELVSTRPLRKGYVTALEEELIRQGGSVKDIADQSLSDFTVSRTLIGLDRADVLRALTTTSKGSVPVEPVPADPLMATIADLRSNDHQRIRRAIRRQPLDPSLVGLLIPLLGRADVVRDVVSQLRKHGPRIAGQLTDALLDPQTPVEVRRRLPLVLQAVSSDQSVAGLLAALSDSSPDVRFRSGRALLMITETREDLRIPQTVLMENVEKELETPSLSGRSLDHIFHLLTMAIDRQPLRVARQALDTEDPYLRGTALEYLETVLPASVFLRLKPALGVFGTPTGRHRDADEVRAELLRIHESSAAFRKDDPHHGDNH